MTDKPKRVPMVKFCGLKLPKAMFKPSATVKQDIKTLLKVASGEVKMADKKIAVLITGLWHAEICGNKAAKEFFMAINQIAEQK